MHNKEQRDIELFIVDIFVAMVKIKEYIEPFNDEDEFRHSSLHWDASIRQFEVIGEALNNVLKNEIFALSSPKYFRKIVNFRNVIAHGYFGIDANEVWDVITNKLTLLNTDLYDVIVSTNIDLTYAIETSITEYTRLNDMSVVNYLKTLGKKM